MESYGIIRFSFDLMQLSEPFICPSSYTEDTEDRAIVYLSHTHKHITHSICTRVDDSITSYFLPLSLSLFPLPPHAERTEQREMKNISSNTQQMQLYRRAEGGND